MVRSTITRFLPGMYCKFEFQWRGKYTNANMKKVLISNKNLTFLQFVNLGNPSYSTVNVTTCDSPIAGVITATLGVDYNFIIILLICILVLILLVIAIVFYRKKKNYEEVKGELGDDVRENIINYSDEGGGEGDQTGYDLSVLMVIFSIIQIIFKSCP